MVKYMKKKKIPGGVDSMEVSGVRTRAKTLTLRRLRKSPATKASSYLQLRSRRLEKTTATKPKTPPSPKSGDSERSSSKKETAEADFGVDASFGENFPQSKPRSGSTRETTPCSLVGDSEARRTPGSTTKPTDSISTDMRSWNPMCGDMPTAKVMMEFFAKEDQLQQEKFKEKYNFDLVAGVPLPGRFEWVKVDASPQH